MLLQGPRVGFLATERIINGAILLAAFYDVCVSLNPLEMDHDGSQGPFCVFTALDFLAFNQKTPNASCIQLRET